MKILYQMGNVLLYPSLVNNVQLSERRASITKEIVLTGNGARHNPMPYGRRIFDSTEVSVSGSLTSKSTYGLTQIVSKLKSLQGRRDMPIIIYEWNSDLPNPELRWMYTRGTITSVEATSEYGETLDGLRVVQISLDAKVDPTWQPLLSWYWEYRPELSLISSVIQSVAWQNGVDNLFTHPTEYNMLNGDTDVFYEWPDTYSELETALWPTKYQNGGGYGADYRPFTRFFISSHPITWPAAPSAKYALTNLMGQGSVTITIETEDISNTASLDLEELDELLEDAGYFGVQPSDVIFVGNVKPFCSFIYRSGTLIEDFVPNWVYTGDYPGELATGLNTVIFTGTDTTGKFAVDVQFGAL